MRAILVTEFGGPEVLIPTDVPEPEAGEGQLLLTVDRAGINYADTHQAEDTYLSRTTLPLIPGGEVVGRTDGRAPRRGARRRRRVRRARGRRPSGARSTCPTAWMTSPPWR